MPWCSFDLDIFLFSHIPIFLVIWRIDYGPKIRIIGTAMYLFLFSMIFTIEKLGNGIKSVFVYV